MNTICVNRYRIENQKYNSSMTFIIVSKRLAKLMIKENQWKIPIFKLNTYIALHNFLFIGYQPNTFCFIGYKNE